MGNCDPPNLVADLAGHWYDESMERRNAIEIAKQQANRIENLSNGDTRMVYASSILATSMAKFLINNGVEIKYQTGQLEVEV